MFSLLRNISSQTQKVEKQNLPDEQIHIKILNSIQNIIKFIKRIFMEMLNKLDLFTHPSSSIKDNSDRQNSGDSITPNFWSKYKKIIILSTLGVVGMLCVARLLGPYYVEYTFQKSYEPIKRAPELELQKNKQIKDQCLNNLAKWYQPEKNKLDELDEEFHQKAIKLTREEIKVEVSRLWDLRVELIRKRNTIKHICNEILFGGLYPDVLLKDPSLKVTIPSVSG